LFDKLIIGLVGRMFFYKKIKKINLVLTWLDLT
jgi:hypothetical protein